VALASTSASLDRTDRIWASDSLDPIERLDNQRYTGLVVPPEMIGMHLTSPVVHSSGRTVSLELSAAVALLGHFGIEWDLTSVGEPDRERIAAWVVLAKRARPLVATGRVVHVDGAESGIDVRGIVAADAASAMFTITQTASTASHPPGRVLIAGLDDARDYRVRIVAGADGPGQSPLAWAQQDIVMSGRALSAVGLRPPAQYPQQSTVIEFTAER
jgi:alpha-galactosidase